MDGFVEAVSSADGVRIAHLDLLTEVSGHTWNSPYRLLVVASHRSRILVRGGQFFPIPTDATLSGFSLGKGCLQQGWVGDGVRMQIHSDGPPIVTSPVRSIALHDAAEAHWRAV